MTTHQIERFAENKMNGYDRRLMAGQITQTEYDVLVKALDKDCDDLYRRQLRSEVEQNWNKVL